ncbi:unnamed protein product [Vicia faba]|uniref:F-box/kelch-repeat protein n=1 Tax=Vicia faba TaxID=3906 RepID=A0AAV0YTP3_VICFA|nr:unnamed protein product [Vicia faba]
MSFAIGFYELIPKNYNSIVILPPLHRAAPCSEKPSSSTSLPIPILHARPIPIANRLHHHHRECLITPPPTPSSLHDTRDPPSNHRPRSRCGKTPFRFIGNLVDIEDRLDVEIYDPLLGSWDLAPPLPADFRSGNSSSSLSPALFEGKFYVFGIYSCFVSSFDLKLDVWSDVRVVRPSGVVFSFLISCRESLVLAGVCNSSSGSSFTLWEVDEMSMEICEISVMPHDLLCGLFDGDEDDRFASLKMYPACVCEIRRGRGGEKSECYWRRVPQLPSLMNRFHKVVSFCSGVSLYSILGVGQHHGLH